jgi:hypothetical protein
LTSSTVLDKLRARLSATQRRLLNAVAAYEEKNPAGIPALVLNSKLEFDEAQLEVALNPLGGDIVFSSGSDHVLRRFRLTFLGFLLTDQGQELEDLFVRYFEYRREVLTSDPETGRKVDIPRTVVRSVAAPLRTVLCEQPRISPTSLAVILVFGARRMRLIGLARHCLGMGW